MHVDKRGNLIQDKDARKFVYVPGKNQIEVKVKTPFSPEALKDILPVSVSRIIM